MKTIKFEVDVVKFMAEHCLSISLVDHFIPFIKKYSTHSFV